MWQMSPSHTQVTNQIEHEFRRNIQLSLTKILERTRVLSLLHNENIQEIYVYIYFIQGRKCALSLERFLAHVAWSGDIGKMLAGPRMENLMFAQGEDGDGEDDCQIVNEEMQRYSE